MPFPNLDPTVKGSKAALCSSRHILQVQMVYFVPWQQSILEERKESGGEGGGWRGKEKEKERRKMVGNSVLAVMFLLVYLQ